MAAAVRPRGRIRSRPGGFAVARSPGIGGKRPWASSSLTDAFRVLVAGGEEALPREQAAPDDLSGIRGGWCLLGHLTSLPIGSMIRIRYVSSRGSDHMHKKLTITIDEQVYEGLHKIIGRGRISQFIEDLVRPHVVLRDLEAAYQQMAQDEEREAEALEWAEATLGDVADETR